MAGFGTLIYLLIFGFIIYFLISVLRYMRAKTHNDVLLLKKLDEIAQKIDKSDGNG
ncbi:hypothetical protein M3212_08105 [Alkalihalobacillus oceani]|uniref:hypothetical protein n=1 Tax=Halalkalibacter oceani TaxID=1653776 RepID=UPI0020414D9A|nr:hypothetical protein [Halalkalibacter oceani]MCM3760749.1 hypothetical protein [Halalkalibacter oceani]